MGVLVNQIVKILSQSLHISNYYTVYFKYLTILFVDYTSINLKKMKVLYFSMSYALRELCLE